MPPKKIGSFAGDPTDETARYLKAQAVAFGACAPKASQSLRIHLEITVAPTGRIEGHRVRNLEPIPTEVVRCVESVVRTLSPPAFDSDAPEIFAVTIVL